MFKPAAKLCFLALSLLAAKANLAAAQEIQKASSLEISENRIHEVLVAIAKLDPKFTIIKVSGFSIESGDLTINVRADKPTLFAGQPYNNGAPLVGLYGQIDVSEKFYGVELILHYLLMKGNTPYGGALVQEHVTVLYEETPRFKEVRPRVYDSKPFAVNKDGTFVDTQLFGRFHAPLPEKTTQVLKQEFILNSELIATIYILRTPKEIRPIGYSVPPLLSLTISDENSLLQKNH